MIIRETDENVADISVEAVVIGLYAMRRLAAVQEEGEVPKEKVVSEVLDFVVLPFKMVSSVDGLRTRAVLPVATLLRLKRKGEEQELTD